MIEKVEALVIWQLDEKSLDKAGKDLLQKVKRLESATGIQLATRITNVKNELQRVKSDIKEAERRGDLTAKVDLQIRETQLSKVLSIARKDLTDFTSSGQVGVSRLSQSLQSFQWSVLSIVWWLWLWSIFSKITSSTYSLSSNLEQNTIAFETMLWSADRAKILITDLSNFAKNTPFEITGIRWEAKQLLAMWIDVENLIPTMKNLWDVAAWLWWPDSFWRLTYAFWQVKSAWRLMWTELKQFTETGVPLLAELWKNLWKTTEEIRNMISDGDISFENVSEAFRTMSSEGGKFANLMDSQSKTVAWLWSNLKDTMTLLAESMGTRFLPVLKSILEGVIWFTKEFPTLTSVIWVWWTALIWIWSIIALLTPAVWWLTVAFVWLRTAIAFISLPIGLLIWWITLLSWAVFAYREELWLVTWENDKFTEAIKNNEIAQKDLQNQLESWNITKDQYLEKIQKLKTEHEALTWWIQATKNEAWNYEEALLALANTEYAPNTEWYIKERNEIIKNINETIKLLEARKALWIIELSKKSDEFGKRKIQVEKTNTFTWVWSTSELESIWSQINFQLGEQFSINKEISKERQNILNIDKAIADIRSGEKYKWTSNGISTWWSKWNKKSSWWWGWKSDITKQAEKEAKELEKIQKDLYESESNLDKKKFDRKKKNAEEISKFLKDEIADQQKLIDDFEKKLETLQDWKKELEKLDKEIADNNTETSKKIADNYVNIQKSIDEAQKSMRDFWDTQKRLVLENLSNDISTNALNSLWKDELLPGGVTVWELREYVDLKKELNTLEWEKKQAIENTTSKDITNAWLSDTSKLLQERDKKNKETLDKKKEVESKLWVNQWDIEKEIKDVQFWKAQLIAINDNFKKAQKQIDTEITKNYEDATTARLLIYDTEINKLNTLIAKRLEAGIINQPNVISQPVSNTSNSSTVNSGNSSINVWDIVIKAWSPEATAKAIKQTLLNFNKWIK